MDGRRRALCRRDRDRADCAGALARAPRVLTKVGEVHDLPAEEAAKGIPVHLIATVAYYQPSAPKLFITDASGSIAVRTSKLYPITRGDLVEVIGHTHASYRTVVAVDPTIMGTPDDYQLERAVDMLRGIALFSGRVVN